MLFCRRFNLFFIAGFYESAHALVLQVPVFNELVSALPGFQRISRLQFGEVAGDGLANESIVAVASVWAPPSGSGMISVDYPELQQVEGSYAHRHGRRPSLCPRRAKGWWPRLGARYRIDRVFQHEHAVGHAYSERTAAAAFTRHRAIMGTSSVSMAIRFSAIAWPIPRSSAGMPGLAPGVSISVIIGKPKRAACSIRRLALR